jgi:hypothetical protein
MRLSLSRVSAMNSVHDVTEIMTLWLALPAQLMFHPQQYPTDFENISIFGKGQWSVPYVGRI